MGSMDGMGDEENNENVVRFPRNWVGPTDELVPIGPRARACAREAEEREQRAEYGARLTDDPEAIPAAGDFWGEGAAALHHPIRGPSADPDPAPEASAAVDQAAPNDDRRPQRRSHADERLHRRPPRPRAPRVLHRPRSRRARATVSGACVLLAAMLAVAAALGTFGGSNRHAAAATHAAGPSLVSFATLRSEVQKGIRAIGRHVRHEAQLARARAVARTDGRLAAQATKHIHRKRHAYFVELRKRRAASTPVRYTQPHEATDTSTSSDVAESSLGASDGTAEASEPSTTESSSSSAAADSSSGSAPAGPTGVGGSTGGCNPQCR